jgi:hypothetical protein
MTPTDVVNSIYDAITRRDLPFVLSHVDDNVHWQGPDSIPWGGVHKGPDGVRAFFVSLVENFELSNISIHKLIASGDQVVMLGSFSGTGRRTGKPGDTDFCWIWQVHNDKIIRYQGYFDTAAIKATLN